MDTPAISTLDRLGQPIQRMPVFADEPGNADCDPEAQGAREPGITEQSSADGHRHP